MKGEPGEKVTFERVLYAADSDAVHVGAPHVKGASVTAEIVKHGRGKKIVVFKYKKRKRYSRKKGHRQGFTELKVTGVDVAQAELFVCQDCGKEYKTERGLQQHVAREHA
jgi:large subunit ribosomal protein L21